MTNYFQEDLLLPEAAIHWRTRIREFLNESIAPDVVSAHRTGEFPAHWPKLIGRLGFLGGTTKEAAIDPYSYGVIMQEMERVDSGLRSFCSVQSALVIYPISRWATKEAKNLYLEELIAGDKVGGFGLTEPQGGSNPSNMQTHAVAKENGYILNGHKYWVTNGPMADVVLVWAQCEDNKVRGFICPTDLPGIDIIEIKGKDSMRVSASSEVFLKEYKVPASHVLTGVEGLKGPLSCLTQARYGIVWGALGAAMDCFEVTRKYVLERKVFDSPLASHQLIQAKLADMQNEITKAQLLATQLAHLKDKQLMKPHHVSLAKMNNCKISLDVARQCRDMLGGVGILDDYPVMRHLMNLETVKTYEGTEDIHRLVVGQSLTGLAAYK